MAGEPGAHLVGRGIGAQAEIGIGGVESEHVAVRPVAVGRAGPGPAALAEAVLGLHRPRRDATLLEARAAAGDLEHGPVDEAVGVGILDEEGELPGAPRHARPRQRRGQVPTLAGVALRDRAAVPEGRAAELQLRGGGGERLLGLLPSAARREQYAGGDDLDTSRHRAKYPAVPKTTRRRTRNFARH